MSKNGAPIKAARKPQPWLTLLAISSLRDHSRWGMGAPIKARFHRVAMGLFSESDRRWKK
jgi:hypothetical protein